MELLFEAKNTHMEHLEDLMLNKGVDGTRAAINHLRRFRDMLVSNTKSPMDYNMKMDGAPSVIAGIDPSDGKFFVAKKGVFNKNPKVYKTYADIDNDTNGDLNKKLKVALDEFSKLGIKNVIQGDLLYTKDDLSKVVIDGESYLSFHPNTIVYAIPEDSDLARTIKASRIGVVWHTTYTGSSFETMSADFGKPITRNLRKIKSVWAIDSMFRSVAGSATFTKRDSEEVTALLSEAGKIFRSIPPSTLNDIASNEDRLIRMKVFINSKIRAGETIKSVSNFVDDMIKSIYDYFEKEIANKKTDKAKAMWIDKRTSVLKYFTDNKKADIVKLFNVYNLLVEAKTMIVKKLNELNSLKTFLQTKDGYKVTGQEGFVATDEFGNTVKLVDRLEFSYANFSPDVIKGW